MTGEAESCDVRLFLRKTPVVAETDSSAPIEEINDVNPLENGEEVP